jgi:hypothetical protein
MQEERKKSEKIPLSIQVTYLEAPFLFVVYCPECGQWPLQATQDPGHVVCYSAMSRVLFKKHKSF